MFVVTNMRIKEIRRKNKDKKRKINNGVLKMTVMKKGIGRERIMCRERNRRKIRRKSIVKNEGETINEKGTMRMPK